MNSQEGEYLDGLIGQIVEKEIIFFLLKKDWLGVIFFRFTKGHYW